MGNKLLAITTWKKSDRYVGGLLKNKPQGFGTHYSEKGDIYKGLWSKGYRQGQGVQRWHNGDTYEGNWQ